MSEYVIKTSAYFAPIDVNTSLSQVGEFIPLKITSIKLSSVVINKDDKVYTESESNRVMVLHNIFVTLNY